MSKEIMVDLKEHKRPLWECLISTDNQCKERQAYQLYLHTWCVMESYDFVLGSDILPGSKNKMLTPHSAALSMVKIMRGEKKKTLVDFCGKMYDLSKC